MAFAEYGNNPKRVVDTLLEGTYVSFSAFAVSELVTIAEYCDELLQTEKMKEASIYQLPSGQPATIGQVITQERERILHIAQEKRYLLETELEVLKRYNAGSTRGRE